MTAKRGSGGRGFKSRLVYAIDSPSDGSPKDSAVAADEHHLFIARTIIYRIPSAPGRNPGPFP
jgi:hypothetical protein